jgi:hypothetical protein
MRTRKSSQAYQNRREAERRDQQRLEILRSRKTKRTISHTQEAWGDRIIHALEIPENETAETYLEKLNSVIRYSTDGRYRIENGEIIHEVFQSIGD